MFGRKEKEDIKKSERKIISSYGFQIANKIIITKQDGKIIAKKPGSLVAIIQKNNEPGCRDLFTDEFYRNDHIIKDFKSFNYENANENEVYLYNKCFINNLVHENALTNNISLSEIKKILELSKDDDKEEVINLNEQVDKQYFVGELYQSEKSLGIKMIGTIIDKVTRVHAYSPEKHRYFINYASGDEYLITEEDYNTIIEKEYEGRYIKNLIPISEYLNKPEVSEDDIKQLLNGKTYITGDNNYTDLVLKTINDYKNLFNDTDKEALAVIVDKYYNDIKVATKKEEIYELQRQYLNTIYRYVIARAKASNNIKKECDSLKNVLVNKKKKEK